LSRGYAIVRTDEGIVRTARSVTTGERVDVEVAEGAFGARVEDTRE
jgi:exonuclease VII large subunit